VNAGHIYVIAFDNGIVKVGRTKDIPDRLRRHKGDGRKFGIAVTDSWTSPLHVEWEMNEETLKEIAARHGGTPTCTEYFMGADYAQIASAAARLPFTSPFAKVANGRPPMCPKGREGARECVIRVGALDARARETADAAGMKHWNHVRSLSTCRKCTEMVAELAAREVLAA
jgi:hypothetical protein